MDKRFIFRTMIFTAGIILIMGITTGISGCTKADDDTSTGKFQSLWSYAYTAGASGPDAAPAIMGDSLLLMNGDQYITCIWVSNGDRKWRQLTPGGYTSYIFNFLFDDTQVYGWLDRMAYALDVESGEYNWSLDSVAYYRYHGLSQNYYYSPYGNKFFRISKEGALLDTTFTEYAIRSLATYRDYIYTGEYQSVNAHDVGRITCISEASLDSVWTYNEPGGGFNLCYPQFENNRLYTGTVWGSDNQVIALNATTGEVIWRTSSTGCYQIVLNGDVLYYAGGSSVNALDKNTGEVLWKAIMPTTDESGPLAYSSGCVYKVHAGTLFIYNAETGERLKYLRGPDNAPVYQVSAGSGKVFVQSSRHLYAFKPYEQ